MFSEKIKGREGEEEALKCFFVEVEGVEVEVVDPQLFPARLVSHSTHFQALPPRGIDSEHREEQLVGIRYGKAGLEFSRHPERVDDERTSTTIRSPPQDQLQHSL